VFGCRDAMELLLGQPGRYAKRRLDVVGGFRYWRLPEPWQRCRPSVVSSGPWRPVPRLSGGLAGGPSAQPIGDCHRPIGGRRVRPGRASPGREVLRVAPRLVPVAPEMDVAA
jgi:hypothetical protein